MKKINKILVIFFLLLFSNQSQSENHNQVSVELERIKNDIIENIDSLVKQHVKKNKTIKIFGTGQGEFLLKELCKKKKYIFYSSSNMLEANYPIKKSKLIKDNFTAYLVIRNFLNK